MSSAFGDWKVNSSFLTVTKVNVCEKALLLLIITISHLQPTHDFVMEDLSFPGIVIIVQCMAWRVAPSGQWVWAEA